jgi:hypothetical protein
LARPAAHGSRHHHRADRSDNDQDRAQSGERPRTRVYEKGIKLSNAEMKLLDIRGDAFHPEWNYSVIPRIPKS